MATYTQLLLHDAARMKVLAGATALAEAVRPTLGPRSRSVLLGRKWGTPIVCDDGVTIARTIRLKDPEEDLGAQLLKDAAVRTGDTVGDGTTTATLLAHHLYAEAMRSVTVGASAVELRRGLQRGLRAADEALLALSRPVESRDELAHIATVSAHDEPEVGDLVADAIDQVGPQGVIEVEEAKGIETSLRVVEGMQFDKGYLSPYFVTDPERMEAVLIDPVILLHEKRIASVGELLPLLEDLVSKGRPLLVIAETVEGEALSTLVVNKLRGTFLAVAAKAPGFGERRRAMLEDAAILTGGQLISEDVGLKLENVRIEHLGRADRVVVDKDTTTIIGGGGKPDAVEARCAELRAEIERSTSEWDQEKLQERLARLSGGVAVIRAGAATEAELKHRKEAFEDAISATKAAAEQGIVPGGGVALIRASAAVEAAAAGCEGDERTGVLVLRSALEVPARQIAANSGVDAGVVAERIHAGEGGFGFDAATRTYGDLIEAGIIDATKVVRTALENAVSVAGMLLLSEATLTEIEEPTPTPATAGAGYERDLG
jgi:chaperonin GroEL